MKITLADNDCRIRPTSLPRYSRPSFVVIFLFIALSFFLNERPIAKGEAALAWLEFRRPGKRGERKV